MSHNCISELSNLTGQSTPNELLPIFIVQNTYIGLTFIYGRFAELGSYRLVSVLKYEKKPTCIKRN